MEGKGNRKQTGFNFCSSCLLLHYCNHRNCQLLSHKSIVRGTSLWLEKPQTQHSLNPASLFLRTKTSACFPALRQTYFSLLMKKGFSLTLRGCMLTEATSAQSSGTTGPHCREKKTREIQMVQAGMPRRSVGASMLAFCLHSSEGEGWSQKGLQYQGVVQSILITIPAQCQQIDSIVQILKHRNVENTMFFRWLMKLNFHDILKEHFFFF